MSIEEINLPKANFSTSLWFIHHKLLVAGAAPHSLLAILYRAECIARVLQGLVDGYCWLNLIEYNYNTDEMASYYSWFPICLPFPSWWEGAGHSSIEHRDPEKGPSLTVLQAYSLHRFMWEICPFIGFGLSGPLRSLWSLALWCLLEDAIFACFLLP